MTSFGDCQAEVVHLIVSYFSDRDLNILARTSSLSYKRLNPALYKTNIKTGGSTALFWAATMGRENTIKRLMSSGVDLHDTGNPKNAALRFDDWGYFTASALHIATRWCELSTADLPIRNGVDVQQTTRHRAGR